MIDSSPDPTAPAGGVAGALWRQQALRVTRRAPDAAHSRLAAGSIGFDPATTFVQHGVLGDEHALVVNVGIDHRGDDAAPLTGVAVEAVLPPVLDEGRPEPARLEPGAGDWAVALERTHRGIAVRMIHLGLVPPGGCESVSLRLALVPGAWVDGPIRVDVSGRTGAPDPLTVTATQALRVETLGL